MGHSWEKRHIRTHLMLGRRFSMQKILSLLVFVAACGGETPNSKLPVYERGPNATPAQRHAAELFDDVIEPRAVGLELNITSTPRSDAILRERTQIGDAVVRVRIETVTQSGAGSEVRHQLVLKTLEKLAGEHPPEGDFSVTLDDSSPSIGIVRSLETRLGGKTFIAFVKAFNLGGERQYHFHLAPDAKDVRDAVAEAVSLTSFK